MDFRVCSRLNISACDDWEVGAIGHGTRLLLSYVCGLSGLSRAVCLSPGYGGGTEQPKLLFLRSGGGRVHMYQSLAWETLEPLVERPRKAFDALNVVVARCVLVTLGDNWHRLFADEDRPRRCEILELEWDGTDERSEYVLGSLISSCGVFFFSSLPCLEASMRSHRMKSSLERTNERDEG